MLVLLCARRVMPGVRRHFAGLEEIMKHKPSQLVLGMLMLNILLSAPAQSQRHRTRSQRIPGVPAGCQATVPVEVGPLDGLAIVSPALIYPPAAKNLSGVVQLKVVVV